MDKASKKRLIIIVTVTVLFILYFFASMTISVFKYADEDIKMFSDISMLEVYEEYAVKDIDNDKNLKELEPVKEFTKILKWNNKKFRVYAYEFNSDTQCKTYIENVLDVRLTGNMGFHGHGNGLTNFEHCIFYENNVLFIDGPGYDAVTEFAVWLSENWDIVIVDR